MNDLHQEMEEGLTTVASKPAISGETSKKTDESEAQLLERLHKEMEKSLIKISPEPDIKGSLASMEPTIKTAEVRKVKVITKVSVLNIRAQPSPKSRIIGKLKKGAEVRLLNETNYWYRIVYSTGKDGWISKRYSEEIK